jgi:hypothetical protein
MTLHNLTDKAVQTTFEADVRPGPSFGDPTTRTLRIVAPGLDREVVVSESTGWLITLPVTLAPGDTELKISAIAPTTPRLAVPGDSRLMITDIRRPRVH